MSLNLSNLSSTELLKKFNKYKKNIKPLLRAEGIQWGSFNKIQINSTTEEKFERNKLSRSLQNLETRADRLSRQYIIDFITRTLQVWGYAVDEADNLVKIAVPASAEPEHYLCYYWQQDIGGNHQDDGVELGYFCLFNSGSEVVGAKMELYNTHVQLNGGPLENIPMGVLSAPAGNISVHAQSLIIRLDDIDYPEIKSQLSLFSGRPYKIGGPLPEVLIGTYTTVGRNSAAGQPVAGLLYLQKIGDYKSAIQRILSTDRHIPNSVYHYLFGSRLDAGAQTLKSATKLRSLEETTSLAAYEGIYKGDLIAETKGKPVHDTVAISLNANSLALMYVPADNLPGEHSYRIYTGRIRQVKEFNDNLIGFFDIARKSKMHRFTVYIYRRSNISEDQNFRIYGVYAGIDFKSEKIIAGRIRLTKTAYSINDDISIFRHLVARKQIINQDFGNDHDLTTLFTTSNHEFNFLETLNNGQEDKIRQIAKNGEHLEFAGNYFIYGLSSQQNKISKLPIVIDENGVVKLFRKSEQHSGKAYFNTEREVLSIHMHSKSSDAPVAHYLFSMLKIRRTNKLHHAFGISTRLADDDRPSGRVEILVKANEAWPSPPVSERLEIDTEAFYKEDTSLQGLLTWLTGKYNRYLKSPMRPNKTYSRRQHEQYVNIHFYAACYLAAKGSSYFKSAARNLYQAYLHGFADVDLLNTEIGKNGALEKLVTEPVEVLPELQSESLIITLPALTPKLLIEKIRRRASHLAHLKDRFES